MWGSIVARFGPLFVPSSSSLVAGGFLCLVVGHLDNLGYCGGFGSVWAWLTGRQSHLILGVHV